MQQRPMLLVHHRHQLPLRARLVPITQLLKTRPLLLIQAHPKRSLSSPPLRIQQPPPRLQLPLRARQGYPKMHLSSRPPRIPRRPPRLQLLLKKHPALTRQFLKPSHQPRLCRLLLRHQLTRSQLQ